MTSLLRTSSSSSKFIVATSTIATAGALAWSSHDRDTQTAAAYDATTSPPSFRIETNLMDKIAAKPYLPPKLLGGSDDFQYKRPQGVPRRIRVLAIDVPEMRHEAFDGECRVNLNRVFADGTAPPKILTTTAASSSTTTKVDVMQKSLAKALVKCRSMPSKRIGVELLEASVMDLNPHNLRRTHQFGNFRYDPGKYAKKSSTAADDDEEEEEDGEPDEQGLYQHLSGFNATEDTNQQQHTNNKPSKDNTGHTRVVRRHTTVHSVLATEEDEIDAPWNQYAWIEELQLRVRGQIPFGMPTQPASRMSRLLHGNVFQSTVPSQRKVWEWFLPPWFHRDPSGVDGETKDCWASHKPHVVIADGAAMQRVPGSLRFLQTTCQEAKVPLFIIHDPRVWGGNTHQDFTEALKDMRKTMKQNVIRQAMQGGTTFTRGRVLGQAETEAKWQAKDMGRRTRQAVRDATERLRRERENNWKTLSSKELERRLVERGVIVVKTPPATEVTTNDTKETEKSPTVIVTCTKAMMELARQCLALTESSVNEEQHAPDNTEIKDGTIDAAK